MTTSDDVQRIQIATRLREAREYIGLSQDEVALALGLSRPAISNIEMGSRKVEAVELNKLARLYGKTMEWLSTGITPQPSAPEQLAFLARAMNGLSSKDIDEVARFAEFLKHSSKSKNGN